MTNFPALEQGQLIRDRDVQWVERQTFSAQKIITGSLQAGQEISSEGFVSGSTGWQIDGDGNAEFNDVTVRGDIISSNWDGSNPANLSTRDAGATSGYYLDSSVGSLQLEGNIFLGNKLITAEGVWVGTPVDPSETDWDGISLDRTGGTTRTGLLKNPSGRVLFRVAHGDESSISFDSDSSVPLLIRGVIQAQEAGASTGMFIKPAETGEFTNGGITWETSSTTKAYFWYGETIDKLTMRVASGVQLQLGSNANFVMDGGDLIVEHPGLGTNLRVSDNGVRAYLGLASNPSWSFVGDEDTGMYRSGTNTIGLASNGTLRMEVGSVIKPKVVIRGHSGGLSFPAYSFENDTDTGLFNPAANQVGLVSGGVMRVVLGTSGLHVGVDRSGDLYIADDFQDIGNHETLRADRLGGGSIDTTIVGYFSSWAKGKDDILDLADSPRFPGIQIIDEIIPVDFERKSTEEREWGFLLDQFKEVDDNLRYLTTKGDQWGYSPDENAINAVLWLAVKDLRKRVAELEGGVT